jgi:hypothetical protein
MMPRMRARLFSAKASATNGIPTMISAPVPTPAKKRKKPSWNGVCARPCSAVKTLKIRMLSASVRTRPI